MALVDGSLKHNWSGSHPSKLSGTTLFNVVGKLTVPEYQPTPKPAICRDENNHRRHERTPTHRGNTKLAFKIKFTAQTENGQTVSEVLPLKQYPIDQVRQEYVDLNRMIPSRVDPKWRGQETYDFGHYQVMLNAGLYNYHQKWVDAINNIHRKNLPNLAINDFTLNSGYRNPHHNRHHAGSTGFSAHMYGYALDVDGRDIDGIAGDDQQKMVDAAYAIPHPNRARFSQKYANKTHVHADWAWPNWYAFSKTPGARAGDAPTFSLPPQGTDRALQSSNNNNNNGNNGNSGNPGNSETLHACGVHLSTVSGDHSYGRLTCGVHSDYACQELPRDRTYISSCTETNSSGNTCNNSSGYYACNPHTHTYSSSSLVSCARRHCNIMLSNAYEHSVICTGCKNRYWTCPTAAGRNHHTWISSCASTDSNGNTCTNSSGYYKCSPHTHSYPSANNDDGNSGDSGDSGNGNTNSNTVTCAAGHSYRADHPNRAYLDTLHRTRTCRREACGRSWECCVSGWAPAGCPAAPGYVCWGTDE